MATSKTQGSRCGSAACVDVKPVDADQFKFVSTTQGNYGFVIYTRDELVQFLGDVKAGRWDHLLGE